VPLESAPDSAVISVITDDSRPLTVTVEEHNRNEWCTCRVLVLDLRVHLVLRAVSPAPFLGPSVYSCVPRSSSGAVSVQSLSVHMYAGAILLDSESGMHELRSGNSFGWGRAAPESPIRDLQ
jgi:hypothetical protein